MTWSYRPPAGGGKRDKERARLERRELKAAKKELRKAEKLQGVEIDSLPEDQQGLVRFLSHDGHGQSS